MARIGIMQGRLVPPIDNRIQCFPRDRWPDEFELGKQAGIDCIEWIYDLYGADVNPIATDAGIAQIKSLSEQTGVRVLSICADYFMDRPLVRASAGEWAERLAIFDWLLGRGALLGINRIVVPFVDASRIETDEELESVIVTLQRILPMAERTGIEIHLETSLPPARFAALLERLPHPLLKANYDSGNSASLGYHPHDEFAAYGHRIGSIHIKDRLLGGSTVPLGHGNTDFVALAEELRRVNYQGDFILQVARGQPGEEVEWTRKNRQFVERLLAQS
ncbi:MAG: sugar phosphate isomerase/epimerase [Anaerolineales bacterium]|nr:sugar phosphate isomerase/epimerase [Anaerolineales bacterium]MCX7609500.1 sugar phosphate isomerase/epimerase [Anaerolineales bacterium]MDW8227737.1 sugar phosphate isomerase/epimerase family protein [Anaerolineales bacterium]